MSAPYYQDSHVTIVHGDCRDVLPGLGPVDHTITDPPFEGEAHTKGRRVKQAYNAADDSWYGSGNNGVARAAVLPFAAIDEATRLAVAMEIGRRTRRWSLVFCQVEATHAWAAALVAGDARYMRTSVWVKPDGQPQFTGDRPGMGYESIVVCHAAGRSRWNAGGKLGVYTFNKTDGVGPAPHPTTKPGPLMRALVEDFTDPGETVLDPFAGSGSLGVACKMLDRKAILIEREEKYAEIAAKRCAAAKVQEVMRFDAPELKPVKGGLFG